MLDAQFGIASPIPTAEEGLNIGISKSPGSNIFQNLSCPMLKNPSKSLVRGIVSCVIVQPTRKLPRKLIVRQSEQSQPFVFRQMRNIPDGNQFVRLGQFVVLECRGVDSYAMMSERKVRNVR